MSQPVDVPAAPPVQPWENPPPKYRIVCISLYAEDLARSDLLVESLRDSGLTSMNRSALIRAALKQFNVTEFVVEHREKMNQKP